MFAARSRVSVAGDPFIAWHSQNTGSSVFDCNAGHSVDSHFGRSFAATDFGALLSRAAPIVR